MNTASMNHTERASSPPPAEQYPVRLPADSPPPAAPVLVASLSVPKRDLKGDDWSERFRKLCQ